MKILKNVREESHKKEFSLPWLHCYLKGIFILYFYLYEKLK